jgi:hypothetical protein
MLIPPHISWDAYSANFLVQTRLLPFPC